MSRNRIAALMLLASASLAVAGCRRETARSAPGPRVVTFVATDFAFSGPDTIPAGLVTVTMINRGPSLHHLQLLKLSEGRTYDTLMAVLRNPSGPTPAWIGFFGGPNAGAPGDTIQATVTLEPGHYALICFIPDAHGAPHFVSGMVRPLEVTASSGPVAAEPAADLEIRLNDYDFVPSVALTSGRHTIRVVNDGPQPHEMVVARLAPGKTAADFISWVDHGMQGQPPARPMGGVTSLQAGGRALITLNLEPGDYGLFCFVPDERDGRPHVAHGMVKQISVS